MNCPSLCLLLCLSLSACSDTTIGQTATCDGRLQSNEETVDSPFDADGDGFFDGANPDCKATYEVLDCNDRQETVNPDALEIPCTGLDEDCDPLTPDSVDGDADGDGVCTDCDDSDPARNTLDLDLDGDSSCDGDCDDQDVEVGPSLDEIPCTGLDEDCDPLTPDSIDGDGDGVSACDGDCDDNNPAVLPGQSEIVCTGVDEDCDPLTPDQPDADGDGTTVCADCDDSDPALNDLDSDGDGVSSCDGDCDDTNPALSPLLIEICDDLVDNDCDTLLDCQDNDCALDPTCPQGIPCAGGGQSVLLNPGFEDGVLAPWTSNGSATNVSSNNPHDGVFTGETISNFYLRQAITPVPTSSLLSATFWTYHPPGDAGAMAVELGYSDGSNSTDCCFMPLDSWQQFDLFYLLTPGKNLSYVQVWGYAGGGPAADVVHFDTFEFCTP